MHAACVELLIDQLKPGAKVLDVGSGSGYLSAVFAQLVGPQGRVAGIEIVPELVQQSLESCARDPATAEHLHSGVLSMHSCDAWGGWSEGAPYDAIHVGAAADTLPRRLVEDLKPGGRMVIPVGTHRDPWGAGGQHLMVIDKNSRGEVRQHEEMVRCCCKKRTTPAPVVLA